MFTLPARSKRTSAPREAIMPEITTTGFPFIDRIPMKERGKAIEALGQWQMQHHPGVELDIVARARRWEKVSVPDITIDAPEYEEDHIEEVNREIRQPPSHQGRPR